MKYPLRLAVLSCAFITCLTGARVASAGSRPAGGDLRLQPCELLPGPARPAVGYPSLLQLRLETFGRGGVAAPPADGDALFGLLVLKHSSKVKLLVGEEDVEAARWRWVHSTISDVSRAHTDYSFSGWFPTACLAAGALTLAWQSGSVRGVKVAAKTWRAGGVLGIQAAF